MRLQDLVIIFIAIALPVIIVLSVYVGYQVDTATLQAMYDNKLVDATHDTIVAFEINSTSNKYSALSDSMIRDIEASINIFSSSLASNLGMGGTSEANIMANVPALLFTLNDGYYIYTPVRLDNGTFSHSLKPYVYYTKEYTNGSKRMVINFSLDNYVAVYYYDSLNNIYESKAGYLEVIANNKTANNGLWVSSNTEKYYLKDGAYDSRNRKESDNVEIVLPEEIKYNGIQIKNAKSVTNEAVETLTRHRVDYNKTTNPTTVKTSTAEEKTINAYQYYYEACQFTNWFNGKLDEMFGINSSNDSYKALYINSSNSPLQGATSAFNDEKTAVIEETITNNLLQAMSAYNRVSNMNFQMPQLTGEDWNTILNNVCVISFLQGLPLGTAVYNDYVILTSTENNLYVNEKNIYFIGTDNSYHRIGCSHINGTIITRI